MRGTYTSIAAHVENTSKYVLAMFRRKSRIGVEEGDKLNSFSFSNFIRVDLLSVKQRCLGIVEFITTPLVNGGKDLSTGTETPL